MVEARKKDEAGMSSPTSVKSQSSHVSDLPSPTTPTFSARGHGRFPSSSSSLASSPVVRESMDGFGSAKRPLTEVKEEEPLERDDDLEMVDCSEADINHDRKCTIVLRRVLAEYRISNGRRQLWDRISARSYHCCIVHSCTVQHANNTPGNLSKSISYGESSMTAETDITSSTPDYDLADGASDLEFAMNPVLKRPRPSEFSPNGFTSRLGTRFPSLSQKWRNRRANNTASIVDGIQEVRPQRSRANSTRAPSLAGSEALDPKDHPLPPTPARSIFDDRGEDMPIGHIDVQKANTHEEEPENEMTATTPLLPPILANVSTHLQDVPYQSPLQSPKIAEPDSPSGTHTPLTSPLLPSLPSPPLSNKPSISSFHRGRGLSQLPSPTGLLPFSEIPPLPLTTTASAPDPWADTLGHANFTITPEPYLPLNFTIMTCKELRKDWDLARQNYMRHLARVGEHYGATSKIYRLTEEKWVEIDNVWKSNSDICLAQIIDTGGFEGALDRESPAPLIKLPSLNGPRSEGKFPKLGDEVIVGPMEQIACPLNLQKRSSKKRSFFRFLHGMLPNGAGMFGGRERSPS